MMLDSQALIAAITALPTYPEPGLAFRDIKLERLLKKVGDDYILTPDKALSAVGSRIVGGRYNPPLMFEAL